MAGFSKPDFWIWMGVIFAVNAVAAAALGSAALAVVAAVTAFSALLTAAMLGRAALQKCQRPENAPGRSVSAHGSARTGSRHP